MTWLKLGDEFGDDCAAAGLSDGAFRLHVEALSWVMKRETGGRLTARDVRRLADASDPQAALAELLDVGFWGADQNGAYVIVHHMDVQPEPDEIALRRTKAAERARKSRRRKAGLPDSADAS